MLYKDALERLPVKERQILWMQKLETVDKCIERSTSGWALDYWNNVRRSLVRQLSLLSIERPS